jgi:hypothetical protein
VVRGGWIYLARAVAKLGVELPNVLVSIKLTAVVG